MSHLEKMESIQVKLQTEVQNQKKQVEDIERRHEVEVKILNEKMTSLSETVDYLQKKFVETDKGMDETTMALMLHISEHKGDTKETL